ncbi:MAG TPA: hypothetical protein VH561_13125 [Micromonosporaceae bacterium]|jgi:hypothetical protein
MSDVGTKWSELGEKIEALALKLKLHFEQTGRAEEATDTLHKIRDSVSDAFEAAGKAVRDDAVKADVRESGGLFLDALSASLSKAAQKIREKSDRPEPPSSIDSKPAE